MVLLAARQQSQLPLNRRVDMFFFTHSYINHVKTVALWIRKMQLWVTKTLAPWQSIVDLRHEGTWLIWLCECFYLDTVQPS